MTRLDRINTLYQLIAGYSNGMFNPLITEAVKDGYRVELVQLLKEEAAKKKLPLIGQDRFLTDQFAKRLHDESRRWGEYTPLNETKRGNTFEVRLAHDRVVRVTVELDRIEHTEERA